MTDRLCPLCGNTFQTNTTGWSMCDDCFQRRTIPLNTPAQKRVARLILREAKKRGYTTEEADACLATAIQESLLVADAVGDQGKSKGVYQQQEGYPDREDPAKNIKAFFDRLDAKRANPGASQDIWKNIMWLQQRPSEPTADDAYTNGRPGYISELQMRLPKARKLRDELDNTSLWELLKQTFRRG